MCVGVCEPPELTGSPVTVTTKDTLLPAPGQAPSARVAESLQLGIVCVSDRMQALIRRLDASKFGSQHKAGVLCHALDVAVREAVFETRHITTLAAKAAESAAEEARVRSAQLSACAQVLETEAECSITGEGIGVVLTARALLSCDDWDAGTELAAVSCQWDGASSLAALDAALRVRDGVDPSLCVVSGDGITLYRVGGSHRFSIAAVDGEGETVESIEAGDVHFSIQGGSVASVELGEAPGRVDVLYYVPATAMGDALPGPLILALSVCGAVPTASPWRVDVSLLGDSTVLASVASEPARIATFQRELSARLPDRVYTLLLRGSRDGMTHSIAFATIRVQHSC